MDLTTGAGLIYVGIGLAVLGVGLGIGKIGGHAMDAIETAGTSW